MASSSSGFDLNIGEDDEMMKWMTAGLVIVGSSAGCGVEDHTAVGGGVELADSTGALRGFAVVNGDFTSSSISLISPRGEMQSAAFLSSASRAPGLSAALGGDVALPSSAVGSDELVIIDRFPAAVLSWVNLETAEVRAQLSVATGYVSNPHDYVRFSPTRAFVPRYEPNLESGVEPFDAGNDVLVVDPTSAAIVDRIDLTPAFADAPAGFYPRADRAVLAGGRLRVLAVGLNADFTEHVASRLISIDPETNTIEDVLVFDGMNGCGSIAVAPDGSELAIACGGAYGQAPAGGFPDSGVIIVEVADEPVELARWTARELGVGPVNRFAWLDADRLALLTFGRFGADGAAIEADDEARTLDVRAGALSMPWLSGGPFSLGDVACALLDGVCLVADAETEGGVLHRLALSPDGALRVTGTLQPDAASGLPPRTIGVF
jgi:hypothetical protein